MAAEAGQRHRRRRWQTLLEDALGAGAGVTREAVPTPSAPPLGHGHLTKPATPRGLAVEGGGGSADSDQLQAIANQADRQLRAKLAGMRNEDVLAWAANPANAQLLQIWSKPVEQAQAPHSSPKRPIGQVLAGFCCF